MGTAVKEIDAARPFITRDDVLKGLLPAKGSETRFDRLVADRERVEASRRTFLRFCLQCNRTLRLHS